MARDKYPDKPQPCACGCGGMTSGKRRNGRYPKYIYGHKSKAHKEKLMQAAARSREARSRDCMNLLHEKCNSLGLGVIEFLRIEYLENLKSVNELSMEFSVNRQALTDLMRKSGIQIRSLQDAQLAKNKNPTDNMIRSQKKWQSAGIKKMKSKEMREKMRIRMSGDKNVAKRVAVRGKISIAKTGHGNAMCGLRGNKSPNWLGGNYKYSLSAIKARGQIVERDHGVCQICGLCGTDVHHIDYNRENNEPSNLILLCHRCHMRTGPGKENRAGWQKKLSDIVCKIEFV